MKATLSKIRRFIDDVVFPRMSWWHVLSEGVIKPFAERKSVRYTRRAMNLTVYLLSFWAGSAIARALFA